jgi:nucleoid DNA-binding protein
MSQKIIIQKLANKHNLPLKKVEEAVYHQFKYVHDVIKEGKFESVRLPFLGKFHVLYARLKHLQKNEGSDNSQ